MAVNQTMRILGFMTGTSLDAVDMAVLETDGEEIQAFGPAGERKLTEATRDLARSGIGESVPLSHGFGLYQGRKLDAASQQAYRRMLIDSQRASPDLAL